MTRKTKLRLGGIGVLLVVLAVVLNPNCDFDTYEVRVTEKTTKRMGDRDVYMIFGVDAKGESHIFKDVDSKLFLKFKSSDIYAQVERDRWYRFKTVGWRLSWKSWYENVLRVTPLPGPPPGATAG